MRKRIIINKITYLIIFIILSFSIISCSNKQSFNDFFDKLKSDSVIDSLIKADYFLQLRSPCGYDFKLDSIRILFEFSFFNCKPLVRSVQNDANDDIVSIENYNREELKSIISAYRNLMQNVYICGFHNIKRSYLSIFFRLNDIDESTLPNYNIKEIEDNGKDKFGVLVYDYTNEYVNLTEFSYYNPIEVAPKWYYYEIYIVNDCDCL